MDYDWDHMTDAQVRLVLRKAATRLLLYTPYAACLVFTLFAALRGLNMDSHHVVYFFCGCGLFWIPYIYLSSLYYKFCRWHRYLIGYDGFVGLLMYMELWWGFGSWRMPIDWFLFALGLFLLLRVGGMIHRRQFQGHADVGDPVDVDKLLAEMAEDLKHPE